MCGGVRGEVPGGSQLISNKLSVIFSSIIYCNQTSHLTWTAVTVWRTTMINGLALVMKTIRKMLRSLNFPTFIRIHSHCKILILSLPYSDRFRKLRFNDDGDTNILCPVFISQFYVGFEGALFFFSPGEIGSSSRSETPPQNSTATAVQFKWKWSAQQKCAIFVKWVVQ